MKPRAFSLKRCSEAQRKRVKLAEPQEALLGSEKGFSWQRLLGDFASTIALASRRYGGFTFWSETGLAPFLPSVCFCVLSPPPPAR